MNTDIITFTRRHDGAYKQDGECSTPHGRFQWQRPDGRWDGGWEIEPVLDLIARMNLGGPYKYEHYRITPATKTELVIKPTCYGCGMIAGVLCGTPRVQQTEFRTGDSLINFNEDRQFSVMFPVKSTGKNFGKFKQKVVWFNSENCANLELLRLTRTEQRGKVTYDHSCQTLGEYRAAQGYRRCPTCRRINKNIQFCDDYCRDKYEGNISLVLEIADTLKQKAQPQTAGFRFRCGNLACGTGRDDRNNRVRGRVATKGGLCSKECRRIVKEAAKQCHRPEKSEECILPPIECSKPLENGQNSSTF
jgi:hypothetical protein